MVDVFSRTTYVDLYDHGESFNVDQQTSRHGIVDCLARDLSHLTDTCSVYRPRAYI